MRLMVVSDTPFLPPTAGNRRRICEMIKFLRGEGVEVGLLLLPAPDLQEWDVSGMQAALDRFEIGEESCARQRSPSLARRLVPGWPFRIDAWCPPRFQQHAARFATAWSPHVVLAEYVFLSGCLVAVRAAMRHPPLAVIDTHDLMHRRRAAYAEAGLGTQWFHTTRAAERRGLARADLILAIQEDDASALRAMLPDREVLTVPHAQPVRPASLASAHAGRLLVVASYNDINVVGLRWLFEHVWPRVRSAIPDVELSVCGNVVAKLGEPPAGVVFHGMREDLADEYAASRAALVPVPSGTGLKVKLVEALAHGRPVVSTPAGAAGVDTGDAAGVLVGADPQVFASHVQRVLTDRAAWTALAAAAEAHARRRFAPDVVFSRLLDVLEQRLASTATQ